MPPERDGFGVPPPTEPPAEEAIAKLKAVSDGLRAENLSLSKILAAIIEHAGGISEEKEFGCERCSDCTLRIAQTLESGLSGNNPPAEILLPSLPKFVGFPRVLDRLLRALIIAAKTAPQVQGTVSPLAEIVANQLRNICDLAKVSFKDKRFLTFARLVAVLTAIREEINSLPIPRASTEDLCKRIDELKLKAVQMREDLPASSFSDPPSGNAKRPRPKRICGGGFLLSPPHEDRPAPDPVFVVDYSETHVLGLVKEPVVGVLKDWIFLPCKRELPFRIDAYPAHRNDNSQTAAVSSDFLRSCGNHYQLFRISSVEPKYYYLALCSASTSSHESTHERRIVDIYEWPEFPNVLQMQTHLRVEPFPRQ